MSKTTELLFDLRRNLEDNRDNYYDLRFDLTDKERINGFDKHKNALIEVNKLIDIFNIIVDFSELECDQRRSSGHNSRCDYCGAYVEEKCRLKK